jgi:DNA-binding transcriptional ArsR family regulator
MKSLPGPEIDTVRHGRSRTPGNSTLVTDYLQLFSRVILIYSDTAMWSLLSNHGRALLCMAQDPDIRLRDLAAQLGITERRAFDIVNDLTEAGYVIKEKEGRRNRYRLQDHLPVPDGPEHRTIRDILAALL